MKLVIRLAAVVLFLTTSTFIQAEEYVLRGPVNFYDSKGNFLYKGEDAGIELNKWSKASGWDYYLAAINPGAYVTINQRPHVKITTDQKTTVYVRAEDLRSVQTMSKQEFKALGNQKCIQCEKAYKSPAAQSIDSILAAQQKTKETARAGNPSRTEDKSWVKSIHQPNYPFEECNHFINESTGELGAFGEIIKKQILRYGDLIDSPNVANILSNTQIRSRNEFHTCSGFANLTKEQKIYYVVAMLKDLSAGESSCRYWETENKGYPAIGLLQLDNDVKRDNGTLLTSQQEKRTADATGVTNTCINSADKWPDGFPPRGKLGNVSRIQTLHNPAANLACGVGIFMRTLAEGKHPITSGYFGPLNRNDNKPVLPFKLARNIYFSHPLCRKIK